MLEKHYSLLLHSSYNATKKIVARTMILVFQLTPSRLPLALFTKQIFGWHFFQRKIECFIECVVECVNAGLDYEKYILITVLRENIQKEIFQQMTKICLFQNLFFLFFKIFKLNVYVLVYYNKNLLHFC